LVDPGFDSGYFGGVERHFAGGHLEGGGALDGLEEEAFGGVAGMEGGAAGAAFFGGGAGAEIEAAHLGGTVAGEAVGLEDLQGSGICLSERLSGEAEE